MTPTLHTGDALEVLRTLAADSVHCVVTSPPYWGLRDYGVAGQLGLEPTPEAHVAAMVEVFREVRRVLRLYTGLAKAPQVAAFVEAMIEETGEPVVLFGWHRAVYDLWATALQHLQPAWYTGTETPKQKDAEKQRFLTGETKLMVISLRSGAGLDGLQAVCHRAVFGELDWSPGVHEQCVGRVHRDGQAEPTMAFYPVATAGADPIMIDVLGVKRGQIEQVRDPNIEVAIPKEVDPEHMTKLARAILGRPGEEEGEK